MASPSQAQLPNTQSASPPADSPAIDAVSGATAANTTTTGLDAADSQPLQVPSTSLRDSGKSRRPRDVRLIHMLLASLGVSAYQERVPLQLLDFAYRYTSNILQDAVHLTTEGYAGDPSSGANTAAGTGGAKGTVEVSTVSLSSVRLSIASRLHYQFQTGLPKEFLMDMASERNRIALPGASRGFDVAGNRAPPSQHANQGISLGGMRLPPERFCLTGTGWTMKEEWESEGEEEMVTKDKVEKNDMTELGEETSSGAVGASVPQNAKGGDGDDNNNNNNDEEGEEEEDGDGKMEDVFGEEITMKQEDEDGDQNMSGT